MNKHISFTQFNIYSNCPRLWHILYPEGREGEKSKQTKYAIFGSFLHDVYAETNRYIKGLRDKDELGIEDIEKIYSEAFKKVNLSLEDYHIGWQSLEKHALETFNARASILLVEEELKMELVHKDKGVLVIAIPDRVDEIGDCLEIIDYKATPLVESASEVENDLQLNIYAYILKQMYPEKQIYLRKYSMLAGCGAKVPVNETIQAKVSDYMIDLWQKMESDTEFIPKTGKMCQYCPEVCDTYREFMRQNYESRGIKNLEQAVDMYEKVKNNFNIIKQEKESLEEYIRNEVAKKNGIPVQVGNRTVSLGTGSRKTTKVEQDKICKDCKAIIPGVSYWTKIDIFESENAKKNIDKKKKR